jgi:penicillin-binding protein 2
MTPIQLASMMATVANEGYYYTPHIIKKIKGTAIDPKFKENIKPQSTKVFQTDERSFDVYNLGTASTLG